MVRAFFQTLICTFLFGWAGNAAEVTGLMVIDARTGREIGPLEDGATIDLDQFGGSVSVRADVAGEVGCVQFALDGNHNFRTENVAPYSVSGDDEGRYSPWFISPGRHELTATPYPQSGARGTPGKSMSVTFTAKGTAVAAVGRPDPASAFPDIASEDELGPVPPPKGGSGTVDGELRRWHKVTVTFDGPPSAETATPNPFLHYRLNVTFSQGDAEYVVPGYFAGDGRSGSEGGKWRAHFAPPETGRWSYRASFRAGYQVNVSLDPEAGRPTFCDGAGGSFEVAESDKAGDDFRSPQRGLLANRGHHYLTFAGNGRPWIKAGPDIPENFLGYDGFINTPNAGHRYASHESDWSDGDPDWGDGKGKRIIGALNYIAREGGNCIYFLPMNIGGDGKDTFPTVGEYEKTRYHNAKMDQWELVFGHAQSLGIFLHFQLAETETQNETYHDGGELGPERKLYYREMAARFGHHPGLEYDLGEENDYGTERRKAFAAHIKAVDAYDHPVTTHTHGNQYEAFYGPLLGNEDFDITAFQGGNSNKSMGDLVVEWRRRSAESGVKLAISFDEPQKIENDPTDEKDGYAHGRRDKMWPLFLSGGAGFEWYVQEDGGGHNFDHQLDDFREMQLALNWSGYVRQFLDLLPLLEMEPNSELGSSINGGNSYVLAKPGEVYAVYNDRTGRDLQLDLSGASGQFDVQWFDPRRGGELQAGTVRSVTGGGVVSLGSAPRDADRDWACLVRRRG